METATETFSDPFAPITVDVSKKIEKPAATDPKPEPTSTDSKDTAQNTDKKPTDKTDTTTAATDPSPSGGDKAPSPKDTPEPKQAELPNAEFEKLKTDHSDLKKQLVALERELAFYKDQEHQITSDPKAWIAQNAPSLLAQPIDIDQELQKEFGENFLDTEYQPNSKAGTKSFLYDMRRFELYNKQAQVSSGSELGESMSRNKTMMSEGIATIDSVVTDLQTKFKFDDNYLREKIKQVDDFCKKNPWKANAMALKAIIESENLTLERAKELVAKDELLKKQRETVTPTPNASGKVVSKPSEADEKDESGFGDLVGEYKKFGVVV